jgi:hypothetical protein
LHNRLDSCGRNFENQFDAKLNLFESRLKELIMIAKNSSSDLKNATDTSRLRHLHSCSIGFKSGLQGGRKTKTIPSSSAFSRVNLAL